MKGQAKNGLRISTQRSEPPRNKKVMLQVRTGRRAKEASNGKADSPDLKPSRNGSQPHARSPARESGHPFTFGNGRRSNERGVYFSDEKLTSSGQRIEQRIGRIRRSSQFEHLVGERAEGSPPV